jgi:hypothetical protein
MSPENIELVRNTLTVVHSVNKKNVEKLGRLFVERKYQAGTVLVVEN